MAQSSGSTTVTHHGPMVLSPRSSARYAGCHVKSRHVPAGCIQSFRRSRGARCSWLQPKRRVQTCVQCGRGHSGVHLAATVHAFCACLLSAGTGTGVSKTAPRHPHGLPTIALDRRRVRAAGGGTVITLPAARHCSTAACTRAFIHSRQLPSAGIVHHACRRLASALHLSRWPPVTYPGAAE